MIDFGKAGIMVMYLLTSIGIFQIGHDLISTILQFVVMCTIIGLYVYVEVGENRNR